MMAANWSLYLCAVAFSALLSFLLTPAVRALALRRRVVDSPATAIKTHKIPTPMLGGLAMAAAFYLTLSAARLVTHFPTGTLKSLRGIFIGAGIMLAIGIIDDLKKPKGLSVATKFFFQILAALALVHYDVRLHFIQPDYLAVILSVVWVVGVANAVNIIDIMDGFAASQALAAALGFLLIAFPSEGVYVNFAAAALLGAAAGFLPFNLSQSRKIFMGDCGALFLGFTLAALSMGTRYDAHNPLGVYAPLFILAIPIYDTFFVSYMRIRRGQSPFMGSKDHYALRLEKIGFTRHEIVGLSALAALALMFCAFLVTKVPVGWAAAVCALAAGGFLGLSALIAKIKMHD